MRKFYPSLVVDSPLDVGLSFFSDHQIETILIDADNTLLAPGEDHSSIALKDWIKNLKDQGLRVYLISNNTPQRISAALRDLDVEGLSFANKPLTYRIRSFMKSHAIRAERCCFIGDQLFTDMLAAHLLHMKSILVTQIDPKDYFYTRWIRRIERRILRKGA
ncbi:MAG: YqeG family HAD IIIA-type phosphatase [Erysipelotrichaceae bacterium]